jgi:hypothetical protein
MAIRLPRKVKVKSKLMNMYVEIIRKKVKKNCSFSHYFNFKTIKCTSMESGIDRTQ